MTTLVSINLSILACILSSSVTLSIPKISKNMQLLGVTLGRRHSVSLLASLSSLVGRWKRSKKPNNKLQQVAEIMVVAWLNSGCEGLKS